MPLLKHLANKVKHKARAGVSHVLNPGQQCEDDREEEYLLEEHRYGSFAPIRKDAMVKYFIDGHDYCWYVMINSKSHECS
jgi:phospholipase D1/2